MTTYSTSLKLTLIGDGEQSGTWGATTNTNLGTLLEQAITGYVSIDMADSNVTLTTLNGTFDQARNAVIELTGSNTGNRDLIPPVVEKLYTVFNNTTGGYAVRVIGATGTGVIIPNGATVLVYCNGTNFVNGLSGVVGNFTVSGTITSTGAITSSAGISGTTGTFSGAITSVNPTFSGTVTVPTPISSSNTTVAASTAYVTNAINTVTAGLGTMSTQNANSVAITGGTANSVTLNNATLNNATVSSLSAAITASQGGTGLTSPGTSGNILTSTGSGWTSSAPVLTKSYTSGLLAGPLSTNTAYSIAHNLGVVPKIARLVAVCTSSNNGYTTGDEIELIFSNATNGNHENFYYSNASVVAWYVSPYCYINNPSNGAQVDLVGNSNFSYKIYVFA